MVDGVVASVSSSYKLWPMGSSESEAIPAVTIVHHSSHEIDAIARAFETGA